MKTLRLFPTLSLVVLLSATLSGCSYLGQTFASADFSQFSGPSENFRGEGGKNQQIDGIDIWQDGFPNKRYRILGTVTAKGYTEEARLAEAVRLAKGYHADALIMMDHHGGSNPNVGFSAMGGSGGGFGVGTGLVVPLERPQSMYLAIQYTNH